MTVDPTLSHCANPTCDAEFRRLSQGKLFIWPAYPKSAANRLQQKVIWLCDACAREYEVHFDISRKSYRLVPLEEVTEGIFPFIAYRSTVC
jgi:hypothetical protein